MTKEPTRFGKLFGSGPIGLLVSVVLFFAASWLNARIDPPPTSDSRPLLNTIFLASILLTTVVIIWSLISLPATDRGNKLCTTGAFKYVRHPLYAAFLSIFNFGLAIRLNSCIFILYAALLHPLWHFVVMYEERLMIDIFGEEYVEYQKRTGR
jgi:protein-S-isoprenylcysteine O-methyltransferase Ste14